MSTIGLLLCLPPLHWFYNTFTVMVNSLYVLDLRVSLSCRGFGIMFVVLEMYYVHVNVIFKWY